MRPVFSALKENKLLVTILLIASLIRFVGLVPNIAHTDESYIMEHSRLLFYNIVSHLDFDPHVYKYGSFIFYLQSLVYLPFFLLGFILTSIGIAQPPPTEFNNKIIDFIEYVLDTNSQYVFLAGRALTAIFGVASVFLIYLLSKKIFDREIGLLSALIISLDPFHARDSHYITTDVPFLFFILLSLVFMTNIIKTYQFKWYILSGLAIGFSSTIKFFPLALLPYPITAVLAFEKNRLWFLKVAMGIVFIFIGAMIGVPFLFRSESLVTFQYEVNRELLWYGTSVTSFISSIISFVSTFGETRILPLATLIPSEFTEFHSTFLIFRVLGIPLAITTLGGIGIFLTRSPYKALFLSIIPIVTFIYISFYIPAVFERLSLPIVPFAAIFSAVFLIWARNVLTRNFKNVINPILLWGLLVIIVLYFPATTSVTASLSCAKDSGDIVGSKWLVENKIPLDRKIAIVAPLALPTTIDKKNIEDLRPDTHFFLAELQEKGFSYLLINTGIFSRFTYQFENNFFTIPKSLYDNYYVPLALKEYSSRAKILGQFSRHKMCDAQDFLYYEIPGKLPESSKLIKYFSFEDQNEVDLWTKEELGEKSKVNVLFNKDEGYKKKGSLEYNWNQIYYRGPRVMLKKVPVIPGETYTFRGWVKSSQNLVGNERDGFLRIDFYKQNSDTNLPGETVALSPRVFGDINWRQIQVTAIAPEHASFAILSLNAIGTKNTGSLYFDDLEFTGPDN